MPLLRIIVVEDEVLIRKYIISLLEELDCEAVAESSYGENVPELVASRKPDLILMDIRLKGKMDGIDAARKIAEMSEIPVLFMTAYDFRKQVTSLAISNVLGYLNKPVELEALRSYIEKVIKR